MRKDEDPIVVEQTFHVSADVVWNAITAIDQMRQWYFDNIPSFEPRVGFETQFNVRCHEKDFLHVWKVTEAVPPGRIAYDWRYEGYPGDSFVVFELCEQGGLTTLRLTHQVREDFPEDIPEFSRDSCIEGWTFFIKRRLKQFLDRDH